MGCRELIPIKNMQVDHVVPQSRGGTHHIDNYQLLCNYCNSVKGTGSQEEMRERLKKKGIPAQGARPYPPTQ